MAGSILLPPAGASIPSGSSTTLTTPGKYRVLATVVTRAGEIPVKGVTLKLDGVDFGTSDATGKVPASGVRFDTGFTLVAEYGNTAEHLKTERGEIRVTKLDLGKAAFDARVTHEIKKIRDVAGKGDIDFKDTGSIPGPGTDVGIMKATDGVYDLKVVVRLATLSLQVPYLNQNFQEDTITTVAGKDPEPSHAHAVSPKFNGGILCFPTSVTMLLGYWGLVETRAQVMQETYQQWANAGFPGRADKASSTSVGTTPPVNPALGKLWLDTSTVDPAYGYSMKRASKTCEWEALSAFTGPPDFSAVKPPTNPTPGKVWRDTSATPAVFRRAKRRWEVVKDSDWRVKMSGAKIWTQWSYEENALRVLAPTGTAVRRTFEDNVRVRDLPDDVMNEPYLGYLRDRLCRGIPTVVSTTATAGHVMVIRGCVVDRSGSVQWLVANDPYGNLASLGSVYVDIVLSGSVGKDGENVPDDVTQVQEALKAAGHFAGGISGTCSGTDTDPLVKAIKEFQKKMGSSNPDGRIDPGGSTERRLNAIDFSS